MAACISDLIIHFLFKLHDHWLGLQHRLIGTFKVSSLCLYFLHLTILPENTQHLSISASPSQCIFYFVLHDLSICSPTFFLFQHFQTFLSAVLQPSILMQKVVEFPRLDSISFICLSLWQSTALSGCVFPPSKPWTCGNLFFPPAQNSIGDRFQCCALNY